MKSKKGINYVKVKSEEKLQDIKNMDKTAETIKNLDLEEKVNFLFGLLFVTFGNVYDDKNLFELGNKLLEDA